MQLGGSIYFAPLYFVIKLSLIDGFWNLMCPYNHIKMYLLIMLEFLREVYLFLVNTKQGLETNVFKMQELEAFFSSQNSTFSQVSISLVITCYIFLYSGGSVLLDRNYHWKIHVWWNRCVFINVNIWNIC